MGITEVATIVYEALEPLESGERNRVIKAALALLGEEVEVVKDAGGVAASPTVPPDPVGSLGGAASKWMRQNQISQESLDQLFHIDGESVEVIAPTVAGRNRKEKTVNCYLLIGVRALLATDHPTFDDREAMAFCHQTDAYDKNNHTTNRKALGNRMSGDRSTNFTLTVPGLRDAAKLVKEMTASD